MSCNFFFSFHARPHLWPFFHLVIVKASKLTPFFICFITACIINSDVLKSAKRVKKKRFSNHWLHWPLGCVKKFQQQNSQLSHFACGSLEVFASLHRCNGFFFTEIWHNSDWLNRASNFKSMSISWSQTVPGKSSKKHATYSKSSPNISTYQITHVCLVEMIFCVAKHQPSIAPCIMYQITSKVDIMKTRAT